MFNNRLNQGLHEFNFGSQQLGELLVILAVTVLHMELNRFRLHLVAIALAGGVNTIWVEFKQFPKEVEHTRALFVVQREFIL